MVEFMLDRKKHTFVNGRLVYTGRKGRAPCVSPIVVGGLGAEDLEIVDTCFGCRDLDMAMKRWGTLLS